MLNQEKVGRYIAKKRKELGFTQKQLADMVGLTDKAVSKWERGKSMPDHEVLPKICETLHITVNELLAGEDIVEGEYPGKAEETMLSLVADNISLAADNERQKKGSRATFLCLSIGFLFVLLGLYAMTLNLFSVHQVSVFIDVPSVLFVLGITFMVSAASGTITDLLRIPWMLAHGTRKADWEENTIKNMLVSLKLVLISNLLGGGFCTLAQTILTIATAMVLKPASILPSIAVSLLSLLYAVFVDLLLLPVYFRLVKFVYEFHL